jgi:2-C-methyl-D-erythritol 4-phosphate cytidylyltransferase
LWAVIPAAGVGRRMGGQSPKQYLPLAGQPVLVHSMAPFAALDGLLGMVVALSPGDRWWQSLVVPPGLPVETVVGGEERAHSVRNALARLAGRADEQDWILVHDAARPCLRTADLHRLVSALREDPVGGLLGSPVHDTLKQVDEEGCSAGTVDRRRMWRAFTPQMFRFGALTAALDAQLGNGVAGTDECMAMEAAGLRPRLIEGHADNIKITRPADLELAEAILAARGDGQ